MIRARVRVHLQRFPAHREIVVGNRPKAAAHSIAEGERNIAFGDAEEEEGLRSPAGRDRPPRDAHVTKSNQAAATTTSASSAGVTCECEGARIKPLEIRCVILAPEMALLGVATAG